MLGGLDGVGRRARRGLHRGVRLQLRGLGVVRVRPGRAWPPLRRGSPRRPRRLLPGSRRPPRSGHRWQPPRRRRRTRRRHRPLLWPLRRRRRLRGPRRRRLFRVGLGASRVGFLLGVPRVVALGPCLVPGRSASPLRLDSGRLRGFGLVLGVLRLSRLGFGILLVLGGFGLLGCGGLLLRLRRRFLGLGREPLGVRVGGSRLRVALGCQRSRRALPRQSPCPSSRCRGALSRRRRRPWPATRPYVPLPCGTPPSPARPARARAARWSGCRRRRRGWQPRRSRRPSPSPQERQPPPG